MDEFGYFMILIGILVVLSGPTALIICMILLNKVRGLERRQKITGPQAGMARGSEPEKPQPEQLPPKPFISPKPIEPVTSPQPLHVAEEKTEPAPVRKPAVSKESVSIEQLIGTKWVLIAGVITVVVGVGFFLKYAYDNAMIGPLGRVAISAICGLVALVVGEITRRRGYGIVAKGVTALGFAILYAAVFSAYRFYGLIDSVPAFVLAIFVTLAAMLYAVSLDELLVALLALVGGFLAPVVVSTGENQPVALFGYVLLLAMGAMLCGYWRKWRAVNLLAFVGTFVLYGGWFEKFYRPAARFAEGTPKQMSVALAWLGIFFAVYLVMPILHELVKKIKAHTEDVILVLLNAAATFFYLAAVLFADFRTELAFGAIILCAAYLLMMSIVAKRCRDDVNLRLVLLVIGLFFLTIAIPLYLKMYAVAMAWAAEAVILAVIGLRYRSIWTQVAAAIAMVLGIGQLLYQLPMHTAAFRLIFNPAFGSWCFVGAVLALGHIIYRRTSEFKKDLRDLIAEILYCLTCALLFLALFIEWNSHCDYNIADFKVADAYFIKGIILMLASFMFFFVIQPICPGGILTKFCAVVLAGVGAIFTIFTFSEIHRNSYLILANSEFAVSLTIVAGLFIAAWWFKRFVEQDQVNLIFMWIFALSGVVVLWVLLTEEIYLYWYCRNRYAETVHNWEFLAQMCISMMWAIYGAALMVVGFLRKNSALRYIALGLFTLLLVKVFVWDTRTVKNVYRIAAFLATGVTLVAVSYLYQYVKKRGFFDVITTQKEQDK